MARNNIGPSTTQTPYLVSTNSRVSFTSILSVGDQVPGSVNSDGTPWQFAGIPDGIGAYDNGDGTFTVLVNHELRPEFGSVRAHGSPGAFVDRLVIDKATLTVQSAGDLGQTVFTYDDQTGTYVEGTTVFNRLCSADLPEASAFYDASTGIGTEARIFMNGEEAGPEGRAFAWIATGPDAGKVYELARLGNFSWENSIANPGTGSKTVVIGLDDATPGQLYLYAGDKQSTGSEVDKAGLTNGKLYGIKVPAFALETNDLTVPAEGTAFTIQEIGPDGDASGLTGAEIQAESTAEGVTEFLRPEDGAWDPTNPNRFYFATTNGTTAPSRLWALDFVDASRPELGGTVKMLLDGSEGQVMLDNLTVTADGKVILQEDVGDNARLSKMWAYDPVKDTLTQLAEHDPARFSGLTPPFTQDEESSGVIDVTDILGAPGKQAFLLDTQAHYPFADAALVEGGQLQVMYVDRSIHGTDRNDALNGGIIDDLIRGRGGNDTINGGVGADVMKGDTGNDTYLVDAAGDRVIERRGEGTDLVKSSLDFSLASESVENLVLTGTGDVQGSGNALDNLIRGNSGDNALAALAGDDRIRGLEGADLLDGGRGADKLVGGEDADTFYFSDLKSSTVAVSGRDVIRDFDRAEGDEIDLSDIDANTAKPGNQAFDFIGTDAFSEKAGELHYRVVAGHAIVSGDVNGDGSADFAIKVAQTSSLVAGDFVV